MDPADPRTSLYLGEGDSTSDPRTVTVKLEQAGPSLTGAQSHATDEQGVSTGGGVAGLNGVVVKEDVATPSPYLAHSLPTSAAAVIPAPGSVLPTSTTPIQDPKYGLGGGGAVGGLVGAGNAVVGGSLTGGGGQSGAGAGKHAGSDGIWVAGLPKTVTVEQLAKYFGEFGELKMDRTKDPPAPLIFIYKDHHTGTPKGEVKIIWETPELASLAVDYFNNKHWPGHGNIRVELAHPKPERVHHDSRHHHGGGHGRGNNAHPQYNPYSAPVTAPYTSQVAPPYADPRYPPYNPAVSQPGPYDYPTGGYTASPSAGAVAHGYEAYYPQDPYAQMTASSYPPYAPPAYPQQAYNQQGYANAAPPYGQPPAYPPYGGYQQSGGYSYGGNPGYGGGPPAQPRPFKGKGGAARAGDWICPSCSNNNFSWRTTCKQCNIQRPSNAHIVDRDEDGAGPGRSGEGFRGGGGGGSRNNPNDWICPKCGFRNFSRRETCHDCKLPKPMGMQGPVRDSGFNEMRRDRADAPY